MAVADDAAAVRSDGNTTGADGTDYCSNSGAPCSSKPADLDHGVLVVGYGAFAAKDGKDWDVFYVRNSPRPRLSFIVVCSLLPC